MGLGVHYRLLTHQSGTIIFLQICMNSASLLQPLKRQDYFSMYKLEDQTMEKQFLSFHWMHYPCIYWNKSKKIMAWRSLSLSNSQCFLSFYRLYATQTTSSAVCKKDLLVIWFIFLERKTYWPIDIWKFNEFNFEDFLT